MADINLSDIAAGTGGFVIKGQCAGDYSGWSVASAGDVNGDGLADLIIGTDQSRRVYVVLGKTATTAIDLSAIAAGTGGFVINGECAGDFAGDSVAGAGDVNGDGLGDLIVGASLSNLAAGHSAGRSYVVFGRTAASAIDLSAVAAGTGGFVLNGECANDLSGVSVSGAGDVNGDGLADLIVGAIGSGGIPGNYGSGAGRSYVVFGRTATDAINLSALAAGSGGFIIKGQCADDWSGVSVAGAGDVNGDGLADLIVGSAKSDPAGRSSAGRSYVVFGKTAGALINLSAIAAGTGGFVINGQCANDESGESVSSAGDINGDGLADIVVGAPSSDPAAGAGAGRDYVVFGKTDTAAIDLSAIANGAGGFVINGQCKYDQSGISVAGAGDINGDGLTDLIVGANNALPAAGIVAGRSYVVFGKTDTVAVDLSTIAAGIGGFVINGECAGDESGWSVAGAGDVNGDGLADLIVGTRGASSPAGIDAGRSYVIFGATSGAFAQNVVDQLGGGGNDTLTGSSVAETLVGGNGDDTLTGNGGADVLYGGAGDDSIVVNASNLTALAAGIGAGGNTSQLARVDGGTGIDTLVLAGGGVSVDFHAIANEGGSAPNSVSRIESIERIDLTGSGNNTLTVGYGDVIDMAGMNLINSGTQTALGWVNGTYGFAASEGRHQLVIVGDAGDVANLGGGNWTSVGTVINGATGYVVYNSDSGLAQVLVAAAITRNVQVNFIDLSAIDAGAGGFVINGQGAGDGSGSSVASAGDVNGDGLADLIVTAPVADAATGIDAGRSYVVFGSTATGTVDLSAIAAGIGGFVINGQCAGDFSGQSAAIAGDVNGDGLADLFVGAFRSIPAAGNYAGRSYVVFGQSTTSAVNLSAVANGSGGFVINGQCANDRSGFSVAAAGDVNGDGLADLIIGAKYGDPPAGNEAGRSYVVFGKTATGALDLSAVASGIGGFVINGQCSGEVSGISVAGAGDVNGDGLADMIVGARNSGPIAGNQAGRSYVVFGRTGTNAINLFAVAAGAGGFVINGQCANDQSGNSVSSAGDVNGDGLADVIIGATFSDPAAGSYAGRSYVVFGRTGTSAVDLSAVAAGTGGFVINGQCALDRSGDSVAGAGDINGDGLADLIIGAVGGDPPAGSYAGRSYVVFGKTGGTAIDLSAVANGSGGFVINGQCADDRSGSAIAGAGDINGDGLADLVIGASGSDPATGVAAGRSYVIFGSTVGAFVQTVVDQLGSSDNDTLTGSSAAETLVGGAGNDILVGNGGADVLYGGAGDDVIALNIANIPALVARFGFSGNTNQLARVDGGGGFDTLRLDGAGVTLDLTAIANQGGGAPSSASRIESIERVDLTGSGNNTLKLTALDLFDLSDSNNVLKVDGNAGDAVTFSNAGSATVDVAGGYYLFTQGAAILQVNTAIAITLIGNDHAGDVLTGTAGADTILGLGGDDSLNGGAGNDTLDGGAGNDSINGGQGNNILHGGDGNDTVWAKSGADMLFGDAGNDYLEGGGGGDSYDGGTGIDTASVKLSNAAVTVNLGTGVGSGGFATGATFLNIENIEGSAFADTLTGSAGANEMWGNAGDDSINGGQGNNILHGGDGNDTVWAKSGADVLFGDAGNDYLEGGGGGDTYDGGAGTDTASVKLSNAAVTVNLGTGVGSGGFATGATFANIENVEGSAFADTLTGSTGANEIWGNAGDDSINGAQGNNILHGGDGNDTVWAKTGADILFGDAGNDYLEGGGGGDSYDGGTGTDTASVKLSTAAVVVNLTTGIGSGGFAAGATFTNIENVEGSAFADLLTGDGGGNTLWGNTGNDTLIGSDGADVLYGGAGNDIFRYTAKTDSTLAAMDSINDFASGDTIAFAGMAGINLRAQAYAYASSVASTVSQIQNDSAIGNAAVFFSSGVDGYLYVKGAGTGTDFDGSTIKVSGHTAPLALAELGGVDAPLNNAPSISGSSSLGSIDEDALPPGILVSDVLAGTDYTDPDPGARRGVAITGVTGNGNWQYSTDNVNWTSFPVVPAGVIAIPPIRNGHALLLAADSYIRFLPTAESSGDASLTLRAWDQTAGTASTNGATQFANTASTGGTSAFSAATHTAGLTVNAVNDAPAFPVSGGKRVPAFASDIYYDVAAILQTSGGMFVAGSSFGAGVVDNSDFGLVRYDGEMALDPAFGVDGKVSTDIRSGADWVTGAALQTDGRILVVGYSYAAGGFDSDIALVRYNADGSLDTGFGINGKRVTDFGSTGDSAYGVAVQSDGKIVVAGEKGYGPGNSGNYDFAVARYNPDGTLDTGFDGDGIVTTDLSGHNDSAFSVAIVAGGRILAAGTAREDGATGADFALVRYNPDGSLDGSFDGDGKLDTDFGGGFDYCSAMAVQVDGRIVLAGNTLHGDTRGFALARYNPDGSLDAGFDGDGKVVTDFAGSYRVSVTSLVVQQDGRILVGGTAAYYADVPTSISGRPVLVRYNADGSLDGSFADNGMLFTDAWGRVAVLPNGKILVVGGSASVARYNSDGSPDGSFNLVQLDGAPVYVENGAPVVLDSSVQVRDPELAAAGGYVVNGQINRTDFTTFGDYAGASITLARHGGASAQDLFSASGNLGAFSAGGNLVLSGVTIGSVTTDSAGTLMLTFNDNATQARVDATLCSIAYANSSDAPPAAVQIDWTFSDGNTGAQGSGGALTATGSTTVSIAPAIGSLTSPLSAALRADFDSLALTGPANKGVPDLRVIAAASADFDANPADPLLIKDVQRYDFQGLVSGLEQAGAPNAWALSNTLLDMHLANSDTDAIGGDLVSRDGLTGPLAGIALTPAQGILADPGFGSAPQALQPLNQLQTGVVKLS